MPLMAQYALASMLSSDALASSLSMKICASSILSFPSFGRELMIAGPPVEKENVRRMTEFPESAFKSGRIEKEHCKPAGRSLSKSYTQFLLSAQRPFPLSGQTISKGSTIRGSPKGTIGSEKRAVTCLTPLTVPCGEKRLTDASPASAAVDRGKRKMVARRSDERMVNIDPP